MNTTAASEAALAALPLELLEKIIADLWPWDKASLRLSNKRFYALISAPTFDEIFSMETAASPRGWKQYMPDSIGNYEYQTGQFLACGYCLRLRPKEKFAAGMTTYPDGERFQAISYDWPVYARFSCETRSARLRGSSPRTRARCRFCVDCGPRPMNAADDTVHRYRGAEWEEDGVPFTRCLRCGRCAQAWKKNRSMCVECHNQLDQQYKRSESSREIGEGCGQVERQDSTPPNT